MGPRHTRNKMTPHPSLEGCSFTHNEYGDHTSFAYPLLLAYINKMEIDTTSLQHNSRHHVHRDFNIRFNHARNLQGKELRRLR